MDTRSVKKTMAVDTALYLPAKVIEGILGVVTLNIFTKYFFSEEIFAQYTYGTTLLNIINLIFMGWISQSALRYVSRYENTAEETDFFKTIAVAWFSLSSAIITFSLVLLLVFRSTVPAEIYRLYIFMFIGYNMVQILLPLLAFMHRVKMNLMLSLSSNLLKLVLTCVFVLLMKNNGESASAALIAYGATDLFIALIIVLKLKLPSKIIKGRFSPEVFGTLFKFSLPFLGVNITTAMLNLSDRLIVKPLAGDAQLGIYSANYTIPTMVFVMISTGVLRGVYPILLKNYRKEEPKQAAELLSQAIRYFMLLALPALAGLVSLSGLIPRVILGKDFYEGGFVISFVSAGAFCSGLVEFSNKAWEMSANTRPIFVNAAISTVFNLLINILFIPVYGYRTAAVSTFLSFFLYLLLSVAGSRKQIKWYIRAGSLGKMLLSCVTMSVYIYGVKQFLPDNLLSLLFLVFSGAIVYLIVLYISGELKEVTALFRK